MKPSSSLRQRIALRAAGAVTLVLIAAGVALDVAAGSFVAGRMQDLALREAERARELVAVGTPGEAFVREGGSVRVQFVARDGSVLLPDPGAAPLPLAARSRIERLDLGGEADRHALASATWRTPAGTEGGTVRVAMSLADVDALRHRWRGVLTAIIAAAALLAAVAAGVTTRRTLAPLARLAREAAAVDPSEPAPVPYTGPADEVGDLAHGLNRALGMIAERRRQERDRLADVGHELAAPVSVVLTSLHRVQRTLPLEARESREGLRAAERAAHDLLHATEDLMVLARGEVELKLAWEVVDLFALAHETAAPWPEVQVRRVGTRSALVLVDPVRMRQVLRNLLRNAVRAARSGPAGVRVEVQAGPEATEATVVDDGPGVPEEAVDSLFGRYQSGSGGTGLGLAVVQRLVTAMDGTVRVQNAQAGGARFVVRLPNAESEFGADPTLDRS